MIHYLIVKLIDKDKINEYIDTLKPILDRMLNEINGFNSYEIKIDVGGGKNNYDVLTKMDLDNLEEYKPHPLHSLLKEKTEKFVLKKTIFDELA